MLRIGIDTGGTFTDFVIIDNGKLSAFKLPSTPENPEQAFLEGLARIIDNEAAFLIQHGSTVSTNALLERKGARTILVTTQGFEDILEIGRQNRPGLYSLEPSRPEPLVPKKLRIGVKERLAWDGTEIIPLEKSSLDWLRRKVDTLSADSVAVVLLYSFVRPENELKIAEALVSSGLPLSLSHQVHPEFREYERSSATVLNAYLTPVMSSYLGALDSSDQVKKGRLTIMQSNGGTISAGDAARYPVRTLFSGPAGGVTGAFEIAREAGHNRIITLDMGGTSTDLCLCDGKIPRTSEASIDHHPVPISMIDIHTVGAGGGSIAWVDSGGLLRVGPQSAGADPGPVCYGKGKELTLTDANLFIGLLDPDWFLGGDFELQPAAIRPALETLGDKLKETSGRSWQHGEIAEGIRDIVNAQLERAVRTISLERGFDTRDFTLVAFGGAAGLHACDLARSLLMPKILIPARPGVLSALGILRANVKRDVSRTVLLTTGQDLRWENLLELYAPLQEQILRELSQQGFAEGKSELELSLDARYAGQSYELNLALTKDYIERFHELHRRFYGYSSPQVPVEVVTLRVTGIGKVEPLEISRHQKEDRQPPAEALFQERQVRLKGRTEGVKFYSRERLRAGNIIPGPAVILEYSSTTYIPRDFQACVDEFLNLLIDPLRQARRK